MGVAPTPQTPPTTFKRTYFIIGLEETVIAFVQYAPDQYKIRRIRSIRGKKSIPPCRTSYRKVSKLRNIQVDHVTIAGPSLDRLQELFAHLGLPTTYGGEHSNQITHMALVGFDDGSYIELISCFQPGQKSPWWQQHIAEDGGPCAWAIRAQDIEQETGRMAALGITVRGPSFHQRTRPDGRVIEWDLTFLGEGDPGAKLPFLIADRTPREWRVSASESVAGSELVGVTKVILGVEDLEASQDLFRRVYSWSAPEIEPHTGFGARLAHFKEQPVILATPLEDNWLSRRLNQFGESPCAFLLGSRDWHASIQNRPLAFPESWLDHQVAWFETAGFAEVRLGVINL